jgi:hypothetical protein
MRPAPALLVPFCLALTLFMPGESAAQFPGEGSLAGRSLLAVRGCGKERAQPTVSVVAGSDGTWIAEDGEGVVFSGTYAPAGSSGRRADFQFDAETEAGFVAGIVADVAELCEAAVMVSTVERKSFGLRVNRRGTKARLALIYRFTGTAAGRPGTARYRLKAKGSWTPAPPT